MVNLSFQVEVKFRIPVRTKWDTQNERYCECPSPAILANGSTFDMRNTCKQRGTVLKLVESTDFGVISKAAPLYFLSLCGLPLLEAQKFLNFNQVPFMYFFFFDCLCFIQVFYFFSSEFW